MVSYLKRIETIVGKEGVWGMSEPFFCPNCGAAVILRGSQWECGQCGNCGRLAPAPRPGPAVRLTILPQAQDPPPAPQTTPAPWTAPTWQLRLKQDFVEDPAAALARWREALDAIGPQLQRSRTTAEQLLPNVIQRPWLYENDEAHLLPLLNALEEDRFARQLFQSASVDSLQLDLLRACNHLHRPALGARLLALLRQNPLPPSAWQMPLPRYEQALARGLSGKKPYPHR